MRVNRNPAQSNTFAEDTGAVHSRYDWSVTAPSIAVIQTVAAISGKEPTSLPKLFEAIDPDSLDAICSREASIPESEPIHVMFSYYGHVVTVKSDGEVIVTPPLRGA